MLKMGTEESRRKKQAWFRGMFDLAKEKNVTLSKTTLLAMFCMECLSSKRIGAELLQNYADLKIIRIEEDVITILE